MALKSKDSRGIGIFDSGYGGLTIMKKLIKKMPNESFIYFGDNANAPYGDRSKKQIIDLSLRAAEFLFKKKIKVLIIACNTACIYAYKTLQKKLPIPVIEIITPSYKEALKTTKNFRIGVIGTKATIKSHFYRNLILKKYPQKVKVYSIACPLFVQLIEKDDFDKKLAFCIAEKYLEPLKEKKIDTLLLACTHYPLIKNIIKKVMGKKVKVIDPSLAITQELKKYLKANDLLSSSDNLPTYKFYTSGNIKKFKNFAQKFLDMKIYKVVKKSKK